MSSSVGGPRDLGRRAAHSARVLEVDTPREIAWEIVRTESEPEGVGIMTRKGRVYPIRIEHVPLKAASILKQEALAIGADSAHAKGIADLSVSESGVVLLATLGQYRRLLPKLARQPFHLKEISQSVDRALSAYTRETARTIAGVHRPFTVGPRTLVMGVVNVTPDSFSDGGRLGDPAAAVDYALALEKEGADLLDVGGESTRPGATAVDPETEWARVGPVLAQLHATVRVPISIDTRNASVARRAIEAGADLVNDVSGLRDPTMREVVAETSAPAIVLHMRGDPTTMQRDLHYGDLRGEVFQSLAAATDRAVAEGIDPERLLIDPGLGFGKSAEQNLELAAHLGEFRSMGYPVVVGASRKSFVGAAMGDAAVDDRLEGGLALAVLAALHRVAIVRTHDVRPTARALKVVEAVRSARRASAEEAAERSEEPA